MPGPEHELTDFQGTYLPLPRTDQEKALTADPRPSIEATYTTRDQYLTQAAKAARHLLASRWLLEEDLSRVLDRAAQHWDWIMTPRNKADDGAARVR